MIVDLAGKNHKKSERNCNGNMMTRVLHTLPIPNPQAFYTAKLKHLEVRIVSFLYFTSCVWFVFYAFFVLLWLLVLSAFEI